MIVGLFTELAAAGGVQRAGRLTMAAITGFAAERDEVCSFFSLNDPLGAPPIRIGSQEIAFTGFGRSKRAFVADALRASFEQPKLIVAFHPHLAPIVAAMKLCSPRSRTVVFTHGIEVWTPLSISRRWPLQRGDLVLAPSADTLRHLSTHQGVAEKKLQRLPWSLGPEFDAALTPRAAPPRPLGFPTGRIVLTVGRWDAMEAYKGVDHLILALPALVAAMPDVQLVAVGEGTDLARLRHLAEQNLVAEHVHFLPRMQPDELSAAYAACDVFALPSRGEGFGLVFLEAMSHGKPVIGGAHGGTPDIIEDGVSGYLVSYGDVERLASRLGHLLSDEPYRREMGRQALERVRSHFSYAHYSAGLAELLDRMLAS